MEEKLRLLLTHLRIMNNVTQDDLAQNLNISRQALSFYERGLRRYPFDIKDEKEVSDMDTSKVQLQSALNKLDNCFFSNIVKLYNIITMLDYS